MLTPDSFFRNTREIRNPEIRNPDKSFGFDAPRQGVRSRNTERRGFFAAWRSHAAKELLNPASFFGLAGSPSTRLPRGSRHGNVADGRVSRNARPAAGATAGRRPRSHGRPLERRAAPTPRRYGVERRLGSSHPARLPVRGAGCSRGSGRAARCRISPFPMADLAPNGGSPRWGKAISDPDGRGTASARGSDLVFTRHPIPAVEREVGAG